MRGQGTDIVPGDPVAVAVRPAAGLGATAAVGAPPPLVAPPAGPPPVVHAQPGRRYGQPPVQLPAPWPEPRTPPGPGGQAVPPAPPAGIPAPVIASGLDPGSGPQPGRAQLAASAVRPTSPHPAYERVAASARRAAAAPAVTAPAVPPVLAPSAAARPATSADLVTPVRAASARDVPDTTAEPATARREPLVQAARPAWTVLPSPVAAPAPAVPVPGGAEAPAGSRAGAKPRASETRRAVVRANAGRRAPVLDSPRPERAAAAGAGRPVRPSVLVVRERVSPASTWPLASAVPQQPAVLPPRGLRQRAELWPTPPVAVPSAPGRSTNLVQGTPARSRSLPQGPPEPAGQATRRADPRAEQHEPARPAPPPIDLNRLVSTVQRRLTHQLAIERERRGMKP
jgi:hypothetical protein